MDEYTPEELAMMKNEEIKKLFLEIRSLLISNKETKQNKSLEIYYCYIARELENRKL